MTETENERVVRDFWGAVNRHDIDGIINLLTDDFNVVYSNLRRLNKDEYRRDLVHEFDALGSQIRIETMLSKGDTVVTECVWKGTHKKEYQGRPATNKTSEAPGAYFFELKDNKIRLIKYYWNPSTVFDAPADL